MLCGCEIDWEVTGTWFGGVMTAVAVFLAARLGEDSADRAERKRLKRELNALLGLYRLIDVQLGFLHDAAKPHANRDNLTDLAELQDLASALKDVPVLRMPDPDAVMRLTEVRRALAYACEVRPSFDAQDWSGGPTIELTFREHIRAVGQARSRLLKVIGKL